MSKLKIALFLLSIILVFSCNKKNDGSILGLDVQPESDLVGVTITDSVSLFMHTQRVDSVRSYSDRYKYLGSIQDPVFGRTDASIYTNFSIRNNLTAVSFGANPVLDSAEIVIRFFGAFLGDTAATLNYEVHVLNESILSTVAYYSNDHLSYAPSSVLSAPGKFKMRSGRLCLVLPLEKSMAQYILQTNANLVNNTVFQSVNKGFYITAANTPLGGPVNGFIGKYDLDDVLSGVNLYYHDGNSTSSKGQSFQFTFTNPNGVDNQRFNNIKHNYTAGAAQYLNDQLNGDSLKGANNVYLNCFGGTRVRLYLPYLKNFTDSQNVSISRAELIIKVDEMATGDTSKYGYPGSLALLGCNSTSEEVYVFDQLESFGDFIKYRGTYDAVNKQYVFNIARQMQKIITNKIVNYGFYLVNADPNTSNTIRRDNRLRRVIIGGKNNMMYKPIFKVTYIKYPYDK